MKAFLLLAGLSKRFWPLTEKSLFPICGKTLLEIQIENLRAAGIQDIVFIGGKHNLDRAHAAYPDLPTVEQKDLSLGMRGALLDALPNIKEPAMIVGGNDVIEPAAYSALIREAQGKDANGALLAKRMETYFPGGYLELSGERIVSIVEKPGEGKEPSDLVTIVAHVHNDPQSLLEALKQTAKESNDDGYERALATLFGSKIYHAVPYEGAWHPVKYPWHLLPLLQHELSLIKKPLIHPTAVVHPTAVIEGNVILEEGVRVFAHATVVGPCTIGKRSIVANNALVRESSVGDDCVIGYSTEIKSSVLASHVWTHMTYIGDSIIGSNVSFGGGSLTGNLRLDEQEIASFVGKESIATGLTKFGCVIGDGCRLGIRCALNPGMKIGKETFISGGVLIDQDVPDHRYVSMKGGEVVVRENRTSAPPPAARNVFKKAI